MNNRQDEITQRVTDVLKKFLKPSKIIIFGSRAKENNQKHSDFDFALDCPKPHLTIERKIKEEIEKISGLYKVDIVYLGSVDKEFKEIVLNTGKVVYEAH